MLNVQEFKNNVLWEMLDSEVCLSLDTEFPNWSDFCTLLYSTLPFLSLLATKIFERLQFVCFFIKMLCLHEITCSPEKCVYSCSLSLNVLLSLLSLFFETFWIYSKEYWNFPETPCRDVCCFFFQDSVVSHLYIIFMWDINNDALGNPLCSKPKVSQKVSMCHNLGEETIDRDTNGCEKMVALNGVGRLSSLCHYWHEMVMLAQTVQALLAFHQFKMNYPVKG